MYIRTEEYKAKQSLAMKGKCHSEETKTRISIALTGRHHTEEAKALMSEKAKGRHLSEEHRAKFTTLGYHHSEETKQKMSQAIKARCLTEETRARKSLGASGERNHSYGKHQQLFLGHKHSEETKAKMSVWHKVDWQDLERRDKRVRVMKLHHQTPAFRIRRSKATKLLWQNPEYRDKTIRATLLALQIKPNKPELYLGELLESIQPSEWAFVGDGQLIIGGRCPDFANINGKKQLIELFGNYWHGERARCYEETEEGRIKFFQQYGYKTLIIWESELENPDVVSNKLRNFLK
ncbi:MAG: NUMOD3 domain-containing DNA-binding protein, partial [Hyphomicrobium sp.]|nr:NUMOD3 domain-containing DNA-binding protein [Hyphomicrobium sp.]